MSLIQLIYVSAATHEMTADELRAILDLSVRHNTRNEVTGLLLYFDRTFMQVIEGPESAIDELMTRLLSDPRHYGVNVLSRSEVPAREFAQWSMGFKGFSQSDLLVYPNYAPFFSDGFKAEQLGTPGLAIEIMRVVANS